MQNTTLHHPATSPQRPCKHLSKPRLIHQRAGFRFCPQSFADGVQRRHIRCQPLGDLHIFFCGVGDPFRVADGVQQAGAHA